MSEPEGVVGLSEALIALREELLAAWGEGEEGAAEEPQIRFRVTEPIELTVQAAVTRKTGVNGGAKWWLLSLGGEKSHSSEVTQTLRLKLSPVMYGAGSADGNAVEIDSAR